MNKSSQIPQCPRSDTIKNSKQKNADSLTAEQIRFWLPYDTSKPNDQLQQNKMEFTLKYLKKSILFYMSQFILFYLCQLERQMEFVTIFVTVSSLPQVSVSQIALNKIRFNLCLEQDICFYRFRFEEAFIVSSLGQVS